jgi:hypothetical protein
MNPPFFPGWQDWLGPVGPQARALQSQSLHHLEQLFAPWLPPGALSQADEGPNSRERIFSVARTFWGFLWQILNPGSPCREVVRQIQALFALHGGRTVDGRTGAYCEARCRLPIETLAQVRQAAARHAETHGQRWWFGLTPKVLDGTAVSAPDTRANQKAYPQPGGQKPGCGFPVLKLVGVFSLATGVLLDYAKGNKHQHELTLLQELLESFRPGDVAVADRGFSCFALLAQLLLRGIGSVMRLHQARPADLRRGRRLGKQDRLLTWRKPAQKPWYVPAAVWRQLPDELPVRVLRFTLRVKGFRPKSVTLVTTLVDARTYPAEAIARLYARRWQIELWFRDLKTTMGLEVLRCQTPPMLHKELEMHFIAYNLIRCLQVEASQKHQTPLERLSFKGSVDAVRQFSGALAQARSKRQRQALLARLWEVIAHDAVPLRPGRREPRAVKRRPKPFAWLTAPRHTFKEIPHRSKNYGKNKTLKNKGLN